MFLMFWVSLVLNLFLRGLGLVCLSGEAFCWFGFSLFDEDVNTL